MSSHSLLQASETKKEAAVPEVSELLKLLVPSKKRSRVKGFDNSGCKTEEMKWFLFLAMKQPFTQTYKFAPKCQVDGVFNPKSDVFFDVNLKLRKFYNYKNVKMKLKVVLDTSMLLTLTANDAVLKGKKNIHFSATYKGKVKMEGSGVAFENLGGKVHIHQIDKKKVSISQPIVIK
jgi:hypothetical protein